MASSRAVGQGFSRDRRVRKRADYVRVQSSAKRVTTPHFVFLVAPQPADSRGKSRLGLVVTRKVGGAVERNRIKRVCRDCFRKSVGLVPDGVDLVVVARAGAEALGAREASAEWSTVREILARRAAQALAQGPQVPHVSARKP